MGKLNVDGTEIQVLQIKEDDYISLTDMVRKIDNGLVLIEKWLRMLMVEFLLGDNAQFVFGLVNKLVLMKVHPLLIF